MRDNVMYSQMVKGEKRQFFFDVSEEKDGTLLTIKESRILKGKPYKQVLRIWEKDVPGFFVALVRCLGMFDEPELNRVVVGMLGGEKGPV